MVLCPKCGFGLISCNMKTGECTCLKPECKHKFKISDLKGGTNE